jgi:hypothetical protein
MGFNSGQGPVAGACEQCKEPLGDYKMQERAAINFSKGTQFNGVSW